MRAFATFFNFLLMFIVLAALFASFNGILVIIAVAVLVAWARDDKRNRR